MNEHIRQKLITTAALLLFIVIETFCGVYVFRSIDAAKTETEPAPLTAKEPSTVPSAQPLIYVSTDSEAERAELPIVSEIYTPETPPELLIIDGVEVASYLGEWRVYGYNALDGAQCGKEQGDGITASSEQFTPGETCAAPPDIPYGTRLLVRGYGIVTVNDRGDFGDNTLDVAFDNDAACYAITGDYEIYILPEKSEK
jgi:3D (Asp-Asp-Asp) domain-containing protein